MRLKGVTVRAGDVVSMKCGAAVSFWTLADPMVKDKDGRLRVMPLVGSRTERRTVHLLPPGDVVDVYRKRRGRQPTTP